MARWYTRAEQRAYRDERQAQAKLVADRLMGKKKPDDEVIFQMLKNRQIGMSSFNNLYSANPRRNFIFSGMEGI